MTGLRISRIVVSVIALDEHDAIQEAQPIIFQGDAKGTAAEHLQAWSEELPKKMVEAAKALEPKSQPNRAQRRTKKPD